MSQQKRQRKLKVQDLAVEKAQELTPEQAEAARGGMTVQIDTVDSSVSTADGGGILSAGVLRRVINAVLQSL